MKMVQNPQVMSFCLAHLTDFDRKLPTHPGRQRLKGGLGLHTIQVIKKALELNQNLDPIEIIEVCLVHDLKGCEKLPLTKCQRMAVGATKGRISYKDWRFTECFRFVALILIADMWSAFINIGDLV